MKIIYVASLEKQPDRDSAWISSFEKLGCVVVPFKSHPVTPTTGLLNFLWQKFCIRLNVGKDNRKMQSSLLKLVDAEKPIWVHFRMPIGFNRKTIELIKKNNVLVTEYFNDDAFSKTQAIGLHWKFRNALSAYDGHFVWRSRDIGVYEKAGARYVEHSPPYYDPERVYQADYGGNPKTFIADAAFIGHWEDDWRVDCLEALASAGLAVILKGGPEGWDSAIKDKKIGNLLPIKFAYDEEYRQIYSSVVAGLCFFSKLNHDEWTRRAFEIVAIGGVLVCERTNEGHRYFKDGEEAFFFSSISELLSIVHEIKNNPVKRERVRIAGHQRLLEGENCILDRAKKMHEFAVKNTPVVRVSS